MLCAHTDTVWPTPEMEPVVRDSAVHTDGSSVLGADDKAAVAAIVEAVEAIADAGLPHPPVEVLFTVGEEVGHIGSQGFRCFPGSFENGISYPMPMVPWEASCWRHPGRLL